RRRPARARPPPRSRAHARHGGDRGSPGHLARPRREPLARRLSGAALDGQVALLPFAPRPRVELPIAAGEVETVEDDASGDARAAVGDEVAVGEIGWRRVP